MGVEEEEDNAAEEEDVEEEDRSQDREAHFVRACTVEMHTDISQEVLCGNLQGKCRRCSRGQHFARASTVKMHMDMSQEAFCSVPFGVLLKPVMSMDSLLSPTLPRLLLLK